VVGGGFVDHPDDALVWQTKRGNLIGTGYPKGTPGWKIAGGLGFGVAKVVGPLVAMWYGPRLAGWVANKAAPLLKRLQATEMPHIDLWK